MLVRFICVDVYSSSFILIAEFLTILLEEWAIILSILLMMKIHQFSGREVLLHGNQCSSLSFCSCMYVFLKVYTWDWNCQVIVFAYV